ncbi:MAG: arginase family protein [Oscillospiraceae bacterium]
MRTLVYWGVPFDMGVGFLSGARMGPRRIREASTQYGRGTQGYYDYEADEQMLAAPITIADCGDADVLQGGPGLFFPLH